MMYHRILADSFFILAFCCVFLAAAGYEVGDIWLASTQWMLVAIALLLTAIYIKLSKEEDEAIIAGYKKQARCIKKKRK